MTQEQYTELYRRRTETRETFRKWYEASKSVPRSWTDDALNQELAREATAQFAKLKSGKWGLKVTGTARAGKNVWVAKKNGTFDLKVIGRVVWQGDGVALCTIDTRAERADAALDREDRGHYR